MRKSRSKLASRAGLRDCRPTTSSAPWSLRLRVLRGGRAGMRPAPAQTTPRASLNRLRMSLRHSTPGKNRPAATCIHSPMETVQKGSASGSAGAAQRGKFRRPIRAGALVQGREPPRHALDFGGLAGGDLAGQLSRDRVAASIASRYGADDMAPAVRTSHSQGQRNPMTKIRTGQAPTSLTRTQSQERFQVATPEVTRRYTWVVGRSNGSSFPPAWRWWGLGVRHGAAVWGSEQMAANLGAQTPR